MVRHAAKVGGASVAAQLKAEGFLGPSSDTSSKASLDYFTTTYRQDIVFREMRKIVGSYLDLWYR